MKKVRKRKIIVVLGLFVVVGLIVGSGFLRKVGRFDTLQAVPVDAVFKVNIVFVNSVHERLHRNFIWNSLKIIPISRSIIRICNTWIPYGEYLS